MHAYLTTTIISHETTPLWIDNAVVDHDAQHTPTAYLPCRVTTPTHHGSNFQFPGSRFTTKQKAEQIGRYHNLSNIEKKNLTVG